MVQSTLAQSSHRAHHKHDSEEMILLCDDGLYFVSHTVVEPHCKNKYDMPLFCKPLVLYR